MTLSDGTRTAFGVTGEGRVSAEACASGQCRAEGTLLGRIADGKIAGAQITDATFSFSFVGLTFPGGRLVIPASGSEVAVLMKLDGAKRRLSPQADAPINGAISLAGRTLTLGGTVVDVEGTSLQFEMEGDLSGLPPVANAGPDQSVECASSTGTLAVLDGSGSSDPEGPLRFFAWKAISGPLTGTLLGTTARVDVTLPLGRHEFELTVRDETSHFVKDSVVVTVQDTTGPVITRFDFSPSCLWPPSHSFAAYRLGDQFLEVQDACDGQPALKFTEVTSSELGLALGSGQTEPDVVLADELVCVRAERSGLGGGRTYSVTVTAEDQSGNVSRRIGKILVPHETGRGCRSANKGTCP